MRYPKEVVLKDGKEAVIRPLEKGHEDLLRRFYAGIPEEDRWFLHYDVMDPKVIRKWIDGIDTEIEMLFELNVVGLALGFHHADDLGGKCVDVDTLAFEIAFFGVKQNIADHAANPFHHEFQDISALLDFVQILTA